VGQIHCDSGRTVTIRSCYATGNVSATATGTTGEIRAGGLIGGNSDHGGDVTIEYCYAAGNVSATGGTNINAGGIIGRHFTQNGGTFDIKACAALNQQITCSSSYGIGRIAGYSYSATLENNIANSAMTGGTFSDKTANGKDGKDGEDVSLPVAQTTFQNTLGWDFTNTWKMPGGYPVLKWQP
jgi:hypothetical protein